jgi:hypothetical protein
MCETCHYCNVSEEPAVFMYRIGEYFGDELQYAGPIVPKYINRYSNRSEKPNSHLPAHEYSTSLGHFRIKRNICVPVEFYFCLQSITKNR